MNSETPVGHCIFNYFEVLATIGRGGMGYVYKVLDRRNENIYALKVLIPKSLESEKSVSRFKKEFSVMKEMNHPAIVKAYEFLEDTETGVAFTMELIEGQDLDTMIYREDQFLSLENTMHVLEQIAGGLAYAHEMNIVHRDLKPANILIKRNDHFEYEVKIVDFGLAQEDHEGIDLGRSENQVGTAYYMAPEQHRGETVTLHSDIYAFGILAFEACTRKKPFDGETPFSLFLAHVSKGIPDPAKINPELPSWLATMIEICAEKDKKHRYQSMKEVFELIKSRKNPKKNFLTKLFSHVSSRENSK